MRQQSTSRDRSYLPPPYLDARPYTLDTRAYLPNYFPNTIYVAQVAELRTNATSAPSPNVPLSPEYARQSSTLATYHSDYE